MSQITVGIVVPVEVLGSDFVYIGDLDGKPLVVERDEWETKRPTRSRMQCWFWNGRSGFEGHVVPAPDLVPDKR